MVDIIALSEPQNHRCCYCGHEMIRHQHIEGKPIPRNAATKDHLEPRYYGGKTIPENMVAACCQCNNLRGEVDAMTYFNLVQKWFKRDKTLWSRWHTISRAEMAEFKIQCITAYAKQLNGQGRHSLESAFRHFDLMTRYHRYPPRV